MPGTPTPDYASFAATIAEIQTQLTALTAQQQYVIIDPSGLTGDPQNGGAVTVIGNLASICGIAAYGLAVWTPSSPLTGGWVQIGGNTELWIDYTPAWTAVSTNPTIGNGFILGKYLQTGKTVDFRMTLATGSTTTYGAGVWEFTLPFPPANDGTFQAFTVWCYIAGAGVFAGVAWAVSGVATVLPMTGVTQVTPTTPATWVAGSNLVIQGTYEIE